MLCRIEEARLRIAAPLLPPRDRVTGSVIEFSADLGPEAEPSKAALYVTTLCFSQTDLIFRLLI